MGIHLSMIDVENVRVGEPGFHPGENIPYLCAVAATMMQTIQAARTDKILNNSCFIVGLFLCTCLLLITLIIVLSSVCVMQTQIEKNPVSNVKDPDSESSTVKEDRENKPQSEIDGFLQSRPVYDCMWKIGAGILIVGVFMGFDIEASLNREFRYAVEMMVASGCYISIIYLLGVRLSPKPSQYAYQPFDEFIRVPMTEFVPKILRHLLTNQWTILFYEFSAVYCLLKVGKMPEKLIQKFVDATGFTEIHKAMAAIMILAVLFGLILLASKLKASRDVVMMDFHLMFEKNWRWNMAALAFLLGGKEFESLEELRDAFLEKSQKDDLTEAEKEAIRYIERPLWKDKRPFIDNRELGEEPEELQSTKPEDAKPSTSKSAQSPQPEEPHPQSPQPEEPQPQSPQPEEPQPQSSKATRSGLKKTRILKMAPELREIFQHIDSALKSAEECLHPNASMTIDWSGCARPPTRKPSGSLASRLASTRWVETADMVLSGH